MPRAAAAPELPVLDAGLIASLVGATHPRPHDWLGQHPIGSGATAGFVIRAVRPLAKTVTAVRTDGTSVTLDHVADGLWQGYAAGDGQAYELTATYDNGPAWTADDPYRFVPTVGDTDL
ncbi:MAG: 1,4-alpha-glucan branching enzyme, partial [Pseudolysinimonas sp.]